MTSNAGKTGGTRQSLEDVCSHAVALMLLSIQAGGAAIGGLFHQMKTGFLAASAMIIGFIVLIFLLMAGEILLR